MGFRVNAPPVSVVWWRQDLRLADHPALAAAVRRGAVIPVVVWNPAAEGGWAPGSASRWWWHHSLVRLDEALRRRGSRLVVRIGAAADVLPKICQETGATAVYWNRRYEPAAMAHDSHVKDRLKAVGLHAESFNGALLLEPWTVANQSGRPFQVFTPFWRKCLTQLPPPPPLAAPELIPAPERWPRSESLPALKLLPRKPWDGGLKAAWVPGEDGAHQALGAFGQGGWRGYTENRNRPDLPGTSRLSPHLHFGEITPRQIWAHLNDVAARAGVSDWQQQQFVTELGWREFSHHLLYHFPQTTDAPLRAEFGHFPWREDAVGLRLWQRGETGYPIVDAGMRELWATGWMHNRVRMIVASFLVKDLMLPWQAGARWFWDTLVDADLAQNTLGWQWSAGCGADAAPYFRIFNPVSQGEKFDPAGDYVRRWVPELARLPIPFLHAPWTASPAIRAAAGVVLGRGYPAPVVDHAQRRQAALDAFKLLRVRRESGAASG